MSRTDLETLLRRAAAAAAATGVSNDAFMASAWQAFLDAHPVMREALADKELRSQLKKLRKRGLVASA